MIKNMRNYIPWLSDDCLLIRFEDLVGAKGGGSGQKQSETVRKLVEHLEIDLSEDKLNQIAGDVHNANSRTFRKGVIGGWRDEFTAEQSQWFKEKFNDLLVTLGYEEDDAW